MSESEDPIFSRLQEVKKTLKVKVALVSEATGMSKQAIYDIFSGKVESINKKFIEYLTNELNVSVNWIFTGEGNMQRENTHSSNNNIVSNSRTKDINQTQGSLSTNTNNDASKDVLIESLKRENELLHSQLERANKMIDMLLQKK